METKILVDTAADLSEEEYKQYGFIKFNLPVLFDGEEYSDMSNEEFWHRLEEGQVPKTSQASPELFREEFEKAKENNYALLCILISSNFSGTYQSALRIKEEVGYEHIYIVDSLCASVAEKTLALKALEYVQLGLDPKDIVPKLDEFKHHIRLFACLDTLKYLALGGRISVTLATLGNLLKLRPIFTFTDDGKIKILGKAIGLNMAFGKMMNLIKNEKIDNQYPIYPIYADKDINIRKFVEKMGKEGYSIEEKNIMGIGSTIGTHMGPGGFGIVYVLQNPKDE